MVRVFVSIRAMKKTNLHFRRFEFKYQMPRAIADRIIPQMMSYMDWDPYIGEDEFYEVNTLYMDSPALRCYHEKLEGLMDRKKVRIRSYSKSVRDDSKIFFELKRRSGEVILKDRVIVKGEDFKTFFDKPFGLWGEDKYKSEFMNEFLWEYTIDSMRPTVLVSYKRKPFFSKFDRDFRVTFDYDLSFAKPVDAVVQEYDVEYDNVYPDLVIMEVKFNGAMPRWFHDIIEMYRLRKDTFSKYCRGVEAVYGLPAYF